MGSGNPKQPRPDLSSWIGCRNPSVCLRQPRLLGRSQNKSKAHTLCHARPTPPHGKGCWTTRGSFPSTRSTSPSLQMPWDGRSQGPRPRDQGGGLPSDHHLTNPRCARPVEASGTPGIPGKNSMEPVQCVHGGPQVRESTHSDEARRSVAWLVRCNCWPSACLLMCEHQCRLPRC